MTRGHKITFNHYGCFVLWIDIWCTFQEDLVGG